MKNIIGTITCAFAIAAALLSGGCKSDKEVAPDVSSEQTEIKVNKRGLDYNGGEVKIDVKSNTYWIINYDEENVDWIEVTPRASHGDTEVTVAVDPNLRDERAVTLYFDTVDGVKLEVSIYQSAYGETISYYNETFGDGASAAVADYNGWSRSGFGSDMVRYSGSAQIAATAPSAGYEGASGGNAALFAEDGDTFTLGPIDTKNDVYFRMSFGVSNTLGAFDKEGLKVEASMDGDDWYPFTYETGTVASGWGEASAIFHIIGVDRMYLRFTGKAGYAIDDLLLLEGSESDNGYELEFSLDGDDNYKPGYVYFSDNFDWITYEFGGTDYVGNPQLNTAETRFDNVYTLSQELVDKFEQAGWVQTDNSRPVYLRLGYIKLGKSRTAGLVQSPALAAIREGRTVHAELTFKATGYEGSGGARDLGDIKIEVIGGGTINSATQTELEIPLETYNKWTEDPIAVRIYNATTDTRIIFKSAYSTEYLTAAGVSNRFFLDEVALSKISKSTEIVEEWSETLAMPAVGAQNVSASSSSLTASWDAIDHAFRYEYTVRKVSDGRVVEQGISETPSCTVNDLGTGVAYELSVRALGHAESLRYQPSEWTEPVAVTTIDKDVHPFGYVFFEDNFDWLDETWATAGNETAWIAGFTDQECKSITTANYSAEKVAEWTSRGYGYATSKCRVYINLGNLKIGRSVNANKNVGDHAGYFILPTNAVADITDGASIAVKFEMDVCTVTSLNDTRNLTVSCSNGESYDFSFEASALKEWVAIEPLVFHNVSNNCTFTVSTMKQQSEIVPNRVGLDNIRISKYDTSADN